MEMVEATNNANEIQNELLKTYKNSGFYLAKQSVNQQAVQTLLDAFCHLASQEKGLEFSSAFDERLCTQLSEDRKFQSYIYDKIRTLSYLKDFVATCGILNHVKALHPEGSYLLEKIVFRIDQPMETSELAVWHQDFYYVKGNTEVITAWIPLQDVTYFNGCLAVMPRTHLLGAVPHVKSLLKKKSVPENIYNNEMRYVEMKQGDCLFFHALLLHTGNLNLSTKTRYSVQLRFSPVGYELPPEMGQAFLI